jgi:hypothetical protein
MDPLLYSEAFAYLMELMTSNADFFHDTGMRLFRSFTMIVVVWFGVKIWLSRWDMQWDAFADLFMMLAIGLTMITYYSAPIPGYGISFYKIITNEAQYLAKQIHGGIVNDIHQRLNSIYFSMESPGLSALINLMEVIRWAITIALLVVAQAAIFFVITFGYVVCSVAILLGPIFIPFFIFPKMEWIFWGWLRALIQYAFYPVVAYGYLFVWAHLIIRFVDTHPPPWDGVRLANLFLPFCSLLLSLAYGIWKIPSVVNSFFSGKSGETVTPRWW